jgi:hypothetical protein
LGGAAVIAQRQQQRIAADQIRTLRGVSAVNVRLLEAVLPATIELNREKLPDLT